MPPQIPNVKELRPLRDFPTTISLSNGMTATFYLVDSLHETAPVLRIAIKRFGATGLAQIWCNAEGKIVDYDGVTELGMLAPMLVALGYEFDQEEFYDSETGAFNG